MARITGRPSHALALIPLIRSDLFGPMAVSLMGGITVATVLTLLFLPALYAAWFRVPVQTGSEASAELGSEPIAT
jgi:multidrug efflux pump